MVHNLNLKNLNKAAPLWYAAGAGHALVLKLLLKQKGIGVNLKAKKTLDHEDIKRHIVDRRGCTPLWLAVENQQEEVAELLLSKAGFDRTSDLNQEHTLLHVAAGKRNEKIVRLLLTQKEIVITSRCHCGSTPLMTVAESGYLDMMDSLLNAENIDLDAKNSKSGLTALSLASLKGHESVVKLLLAKNAKVDPKDNKGRTPLSLAAEASHDTVMELLLSVQDIDLESKNNEGQTPLSWVVAPQYNGEQKQGHSIIVKRLLEAGSDPNSKDAVGRTSLSHLAGTYWFNIVELLLNNETVFPDPKNDKGWTLPFWAVEK
ncbi:ankyrin [Acephala macrosclerotiorum]|nr:ankyrin [Acephala macrosclerotiorum]